MCILYLKSVCSWYCQQAHGNAKKVSNNSLLKDMQNRTRFRAQIKLDFYSSCLRSCQGPGVPTRRVVHTRIVTQKASHHGLSIPSRITRFVNEISELLRRLIEAHWLVDVARLEWNGRCCAQFELFKSERHVYVASTHHTLQQCSRVMREMICFHSYAV